MTTITTTSGRHFSANEGESLLDAALRAQVTLAYSCHTGRCSTCKGKVRSGTTAVIHDELGLSPAEREAGWILTCARTATSDVEVEVEDLSGIELFAAKVVPCRIQSLERLSPDVVKVMLRLPPTSELRYHPGQYVDVIGPNGLRRSYSVANAPAADKRIELHIRQVPEGAMSQYWFEAAQVNDLLRLNGPLGTFFLRDAAGQDLILLATGTGIAPVKAMLEGLAGAPADQQPRSITVYWGGRVPQDLYWDPATVGVRHRFVPVLSRADADWTGPRGHIQNVLLAEQPDLSAAVVYACGSNAMIQSAREQLIAAGLPELRFHSDAFVCSSTT